ncbi:hypothetical protein H2198_001157 [Neophaeococcomyces mojaviensis]|uniref:Uncharacterized protein n=1 Tax=Neophaeococcomyces mojaviensis TaxID=3383035 RepID=A0ACC3AIW3_9EURO|nr:hypothetical protein H2198_001157 [Knufia sp. JES_112]
MAEEESVFITGDNLQAAVARSLQENKALLCFVSDDGDESTRWEVALLDDRIHDGLQVKAVALRLEAGSEQAGFLNGVCPIESVPAIIVIQHARVIANWQHGKITFEELLTQLADRYASSSDESVHTPAVATPAAATTPTPAANTKLHIDLPPSDGRMRLPYNAYDHFRKLTQQMLASGVRSNLVLRTQLRWLEQMKIDVITTAAKSILVQLDSLTEAPTLPDEVENRLLNTPAAMLNGGQLRSDQAPESSRASAAGSSTQGSVSATRGTSSARAVPPSNASPAPAPPPSSSSSQATQRADYVNRQRTLDQSQRAERERIKAQIAADKAARREAEAARLSAQRKQELAEMRKANSTTTNPQASDIRLQVRLFDGSTIRSSFAHDSTISKDVRAWIDRTTQQKAASAQPYDLKLILTPLPNRTVEAGEEDMALSDVDGIGSSATMVMVPVKGYVDSYAAATGGGGGVTGVISSAVSGGVGLVGTVAGWAAGGIGRLIGVGGGAGTQTPAAGADGRPESAAAPGQTAGGNLRVRTLADQRKDEEDQRRRQGAQLYNGMGLNVQPRKDDDENNKNNSK